MRKTCIVIAGPTAVGKTALSIALAQHLDTEIISADSRQCYKELNIGVAKPSPGELLLVPHHFINSHSINEPLNAALFERYAVQKASEIFNRHDTLVLVGGTGLYIKAFCEGIDAVPVIPEAIRAEIRKSYDEFGLEWLQQEVEREDPLYHRNGEMQNPQRLMRALEVKSATGKSITSFHTGMGINRDFDIIKIGLELPREELYKRINTRTDKMIEDGLVKEVQALLNCKDLNALQTVGYKEIFNFLEGMATITQAIESIKQNTRYYAKRQMTWFKKDTAVYWCAPFYEQVLTRLKPLLSNKQL